jgi:hypothetical protein
MTGISRQDAPVAIEGADVELRMRDIGSDMTTAFVRMAAGTDLKGLPGELYQCPHWGYLLSGRLKMHARDGSEVHQAGQSFYWPLGHAPEALEDCEYVDFSPAREFGAVIDHVKSQG